MNQQVIYEWSSIEEIQETGDSVDIFTRGGGGVVVRNAAFAKAPDRKEFLELARASLNSGATTFSCENKCAESAGVNHPSLP